MSDRGVVFFIWIGASLLAIVSALQYTDAALFGSQFIPVGNDSFYHARRILDAAFSARGFYQFDNTIHVPEGSWVTWPWAYDYLLSRLVRFVAWLSPGIAPMAVLAHVAVAWFVVNTGLFIAVCRQLRLPLPLLAVAALAFAGAQLNQQLHGLGTLDHHFIEQTFVLLSLWLGLRFFATGSGGAAIALGSVLGLATAFHSALFILQLPALATALLLWWRGSLPAPAVMFRLAAALVATTLLGLLPSAPFADLQFSFTTHSWFHLYVAVCSAVVLVAIALRPYSARAFAVVAAVSAALAVPIASQVLTGAQFVSASIDAVLNVIAETKSPFALLLGSWGLKGVGSLYSLLIFLVPVLLLYFAWQVWREKNSRQLHLAVSAVFCLALMAMQYRMQYFGSWAMILGPLYLLAAVTQKKQWPGAAVAGAAAVAYLFAYIPVLQTQRLAEFVPANDVDYQHIAPVFPVLDQLCSQQPGNVLASMNDGHYIRYHTSCRVIANNLLLTPQHFQKVAEVKRLLSLTPQQFADTEHHADYVLVRLSRLPDVLQALAAGVSFERIAAASPTLVEHLIMADQHPGLELLAQAVTDGAPSVPYLRIYRVTPVGSPATAGGQR
ncbi:MAG: hypothetical protein KJO54_09600 [Gammaproteobacteria bacterium]|nr:hypothetical protein [Gammaproteobacteria bacterium]NNF60776.1 hypothetical protein [Gammaproteobacteria bacterium]NNM20213.1 hypothetical protein [Gammaproteobacteria bacterium]